MQPEITLRLREFHAVFEPEMVNDIIAAFVFDARRRLNRLRARLLAGDTFGLAREAHGLKGSCQNMGARSLGDLCQRLEELAAPTQAAAWPAIFAELEQGLAPVLKDLEAAMQFEEQLA